MNLQKYLDQQRKLQTLLGEPMGTGEEAIKENILALIVEATELLNEFNWKPWKVTTKKHQYTRISHELADIMKFYCNIINEMHMSEVDFDIAWDAVHKKVTERYTNGY